jgi:acetyl-CoA carboxylase biotin carboxyl carrier protein
MDRLRSGILGDPAAAGRPDPAGAPADPDPAPAAAPGGDRGEADASLLALVDRLAGILDRSALSELEVGAGGTTLVLRRSDGPDDAAHAAAAPAHGRSARAGHGAGPASDHAARGAAAQPHADVHAGPPAHAVVAPLTGIFYASPSPTAPPFVAVGQEIMAGQVIGLIEAMKLFNEIKSDASGRISKVAVENGKLVKAKQVLIEVVPL